MKKGNKFRIVADLDMRSTGGPFIPAGTKGVIEKVRRGENAGNLWVNIAGFGHRHLGPEHIEVYKTSASPVLITLELTELQINTLLQSLQVANSADVAINIELNCPSGVTASDVFKAQEQLYKMFDRANV